MSPLTAVLSLFCLNIIDDYNAPVPWLCIVLYCLVCVLQVIACLCERLHQLAGDRSYIFCDTLATDTCSTDEGHDDWTLGGTPTGVGESVVQCPSDNVEGHWSLASWGRVVVHTVWPEQWQTYRCGHH